jgi:hypothetical protein
MALFLVRRQRMQTMWSISSSRPITGSILLALAVMSRQYIPKAAAFGAETTDPDPPDRPPVHIIPFVDETVPAGRIEPRSRVERRAAKRWFGDAQGMALAAASADRPTFGGTMTILGAESGAAAAAGGAVPAAGAALGGVSAAGAAGAAATTGSTLVASGEAWRVGLAAAAAEATDVEAVWLRLTGKIETL